MDCGTDFQNSDIEIILNCLNFESAVRSGAIWASRLPLVKFEKLLSRIYSKGTMPANYGLICPRPVGGAGALSGDRHPSSVCLSDVAYIGSNSKTKRPRKTKHCTGVPQVTCDSHTDFKVKRSKVKVSRGGGILWPPPSRTACLYIDLCVCMQLQHANACFRQELHDSEPLVGRLRDVLDRQRLLLSTRDSKSGELNTSLVFLIHYNKRYLEKLMGCQLSLLRRSKQ